MMKSSQNNLTFSFSKKYNILSRRGIRDTKKLMMFSKCSESQAEICGVCAVRLKIYCVIHSLRFTRLICRLARLPIHYSVECKTVLITTALRFHLPCMLVLNCRARGANICHENELPLIGNGVKQCSWSRHWLSGFMGPRTIIYMVLINVKQFDQHSGFNV